MTDSAENLRARMLAMERNFYASRYNPSYKAAYLKARDAWLKALSPERRATAPEP